MPTPLRLAIHTILLLAFAPLIVLLVESVRVHDSWGLGNYYATLFQGSRLWWLMLNSVVLAAATTVTAVALGVPLAVLLTKTNLPWRGLFTAALCLPLVLPPYVLANAWFLVLGRAGLIASLARLLGAPADAIGALTSSWLFSISGGVLVLSTSLLPIVLLLSMSGLASVNPSLEDAARLSARWPRVVWSISLPMAWPAIAMAALLTFFLAIGEYGAAAFLRLPVFPVESFTQISAFYDPRGATAAWVPMLLIVATCATLSRPVLGDVERSFRWKFSPAPAVALGSWKMPLTTSVVMAAIALVLLPVGALFWEGLSAEAMAEAWARAADSVGWSLAYASAAATLVAIIGLLLAREPRQMFGPSTLALFALPGSLLAFATVLTWNRPATNWLYGGPVPLIAALASQYLAIGYLGVRAGLLQLAPSLEQSAQAAGAGWFSRTRAILLPLLRGSVAAVWVVTFTFALRDTSLSLMLSPAGRDTLTARMLTLAANGSPSVMAALGILSATLGSMPLLIAMWLLRRGRNR